MDSLQIELEIIDGKATIALDGFKRKIESTSSDISASARKTKLDEVFGSQLGLVEAKAEKTRKAMENIAKVQSGRGFDYLAKSADDASNRIGNIQKELNKIREQMSKAHNRNQLQRSLYVLRTDERSFSQEENKSAATFQKDAK